MKGLVAYSISLIKLSLRFLFSLSPLSSHPLLLSVCVCVCYILQRNIPPILIFPLTQHLAVKNMAEHSSSIIKGRQLELVVVPGSPETELAIALMQGKQCGDWHSVKG